MSVGSKRGAALAIVVVVTAALLILSAALVSSASFNLSYSQNSLQDRQAYLDAKSAIEFGRAYVVKNPTSGDFKVNLDRTDYTFSINKGAATANTVAAYESAGKILKASAKDKTLDRFKTLGYRFQFSEGASSNSPAYISASLKLGNTTIFNGAYNNFALTGNVRVDFPVFSNTRVSLSGRDCERLSSPQIYFMGNPDSFVVNGDDFQTRLVSDFIYFNGNINCNNTLKQNTGLFLYRFDSDNDKTKYGVAYFNNVTISFSVWGSNNNKTSYSYKLNGFYRFKGGTNLLSTDIDTNIHTDIDEKSKMFIRLEPEEIGDVLGDEEGDVILANKAYIESNHDIIIPGDTTGTKWTSDVNVIQSNKTGFTDKAVFVYVVDCGNWNNLFNNSNKVSYLAKEMYWNYVNVQTDFVVPEGKSEQNKYSPNTLVFQAEHISLNTQKHNSLDDDSGKKPKIVGKKGASFFMMPLDTNAKEFNLTIPTELEIKYSDTNNNSHEYTINETGTYHIKIGSEPFKDGFNLFSSEAEKFFDETTPSSGGGSGGSGGTTVIGGEYTDGK